VFAISLIAAIWALAWTVTSFKQLSLANSDDFPKLAPLAIAQGVMFAVACAIQVFGLVAAGTERLPLIRLYAFLCALSALTVVGVGIMRIVTHFVFKSDLIAECTEIVQTGDIGSVFGIWGSDPSTNLDPTEAAQYCDSQWNRDSWLEIISVVLEIFLGLLFTSIAFAYYRQSLDPTSPANAARLPSNQTGRDYPTHYNPPYDESAYAPVYLPPPGPPPIDGKPPDYKRGSYLSGGDKDVKEDDPFSDYDGPSVPMPTHWVEDRDVTSQRV